MSVVKFCRVLFTVYTSVTGHIPRQWLMHELFTSTANKDALTPNLTSYPLNVARKNILTFTAIS